MLYRAKGISGTVHAESKRGQPLCHADALLCAGADFHVLGEKTIA